MGAAKYAIGAGIAIVVIAGINVSYVYLLGKGAIPPILGSGGAFVPVEAFWALWIVILVLALAYVLKTRPRKPKGSP